MYELSVAMCIETESDRTKDDASRMKQRNWFYMCWVGLLGIGITSVTL